MQQKSTSVGVSAKYGQSDERLIQKIKPGKRPYIVFFVMYFPLIVFGVYVAVHKNSSAWTLTNMFTVIMLSFHAWIYSQTIELFQNRITHYSWFFRERTIFLKDIDKWSLQIGVFRYTDRFKPTVRLEIYAKKELKIKPIIIPLKLFNESDLKPLFDALPSDREKK